MHPKQSKPVVFVLRWSSRFPGLKTNMGNLVRKVVLVTAVDPKWLFLLDFDVKGQFYTKKGYETNKMLAVLR